MRMIPYLALSLLLICNLPLLAMQERELQIDTDAVTLNGTLSLPDQPGPYPMAIFVHGSGPNDRDQNLKIEGDNFVCLYPGLAGKTIHNFRDLAECLAARGIASFRYDKRSFRPDPEQDPRAISPYDFVEDLENVVDYVKTLPETHPQGIVLIGHSQGAGFLPIVAGSRSDIAAVISLAGAARPIDKLIEEQIRFIGQTCGDPSEAEIQALQIREAMRQIRQGSFPSDQPVLGAWPKFWRDWIEITDAVVDEYKALTIPILFVQGSEDFNVPPAEAEIFRSELQGPEVRVELFEGLNHYLTRADDPQLAAEVCVGVANWIDLTLAVTALADEAIDAPLRGISIAGTEAGITIENNPAAHRYTVLVSNLSGRIVFRRSGISAPETLIGRHSLGKGVFGIVVQSNGSTKRELVLLQ